jgi:alpha-L-fucosidase
MFSLGTGTILLRICTYNDILAGMLAEVLFSYGPVFEQCLTGRAEMTWLPLTIGTCFTISFVNTSRSHHIQDVGPGCRWVGNERGMAGETNWSRLDTTGV